MEQTNPEVLDLDDYDDEDLDEADADCDDCGTATAVCAAPPYTTCSPEYGCAHDGTWEWYMLRDEIWAQIGNPNILCIGDVEKRLGRQLHSGDFADLPINEPHPYDTARLTAARSRPAEESRCPMTTVWSCPIPTHHTVEWDGDVACCLFPGCLRRSDDPDRNSCECEVYDCAGGCCGGRCSCTTGPVTKVPGVTS